MAPILFTLRAIDLGFAIRTTVLTDGPSFPKAPVWDTTPIMNRSAPVVNYAMSNSREFSVVLDFYATDAAAYEEEIAKPVRWLMALAHPMQPGVIPPSRCRITFGPWFKNWLCVASGISPVAPRDRIWNRQGNPMTASVSCTFLELDLFNTSAGEIAGAVGAGIPAPWGGV